MTRSIASWNVGIVAPLNFGSNQDPASSCFSSATREVADEPALRAVLLDEAVRKDLLDVRRALEREVVDADQHAVLRHREVLLDVVGLLLDREPVRLERVLGGIRGRAAMRDELLGGRGLPGALLDARQQHQRETGGGEPAQGRVHHQNVTLNPSWSWRAS